MFFSSKAHLALSIFALCAASTGCVPHRVSTREANVGELALESIDPASPNFVVEQEVTAIYETREETFRAILQKDGAELVLIGLAPHGGRAFVLRQEGRTVTFESHMPEELPFSPSWMLRDVQRTWLVGFGDAETQSDGEHVFASQDGNYRDVWRENRLISRVVTDPEGISPNGGEATSRETEIRYQGGFSPRVSEPAPDEIEIISHVHGYRLILRNLARTPIE